VDRGLARRFGGSHLVGPFLGEDAGGLVRRRSRGLVLGEDRPGGILVGLMGRGVGGVEREDHGRLGGDRIVVCCLLCLVLVVLCLGCCQHYFIQKG